MDVTISIGRDLEIVMNTQLNRFCRKIWNLLKPKQKPVLEPLVPVSANAKIAVPHFTPQEWKAMFHDGATINGYCIRPGWKGYCLQEAEK